jgi:two-component system alkaline phosphatase synthesis response regulator PhoP
MNLPSGTPTSPGESVDLASKRILVVDDELGTRRAIALLLGEYQVFTAADGIEGLEVAVREHPDLVVTDVWMPRADGVVMVRCMKQIPELRHVPVIFLTGQTSVQSMVAGISAGAWAYLPKPIDPDILERKVRSALAHASGHPARTS